MYLSQNIVDFAWQQVEAALWFRPDAVMVRRLTGAVSRWSELWPLIWR